jgi:acyl-CoA reductase-like NAD-dependent aldehyde dehydrogenase
LDERTSLGPVVRTAAAEFVRGQIESAVAQGARALLTDEEFPESGRGATYLPPQVLTDVDPGMDLMREESFGPVVGIQSVASDAEAVALMNDSIYGLTASVWTADEDVARRIGDELQTGTVFMNRCDYLDPGLCWTGCKSTGRGGALSVIGYHNLTRPKSFHLKKAG